MTNSQLIINLSNLNIKIFEKTGAGNLRICTIIIPPSSILFNSILFGQMITLAEMMGLAIITTALLVPDKQIVINLRKINKNINKL